MLKRLTTPPYWGDREVIAGLIRDHGRLRALWFVICASHTTT